MNLGTPRGFLNIKNIREKIIEKKLFILAPCTNYEKCKIKEDDWCSFSVRVPRLKIQKILKQGDAPYEDEKFMYLAISKNKTILPKARILRHPVIQGKMLKLKLCMDNQIEEKIITKKHDKYKEIKKLKNGDSIFDLEN